ncbi:hypothetical protein V6N13_122357 [Hibiscus sabdariffa]
MLRSAKMKDTKSTWKVLIMDKVTVKVMSYSCKMDDITAEGVSYMAGKTALYKKYVKGFLLSTLHEWLNLLNSEHITASDIYFLLSGMWQRAFVYFSTPVSKELVAFIKKDPTVLPRIGGMSEVGTPHSSLYC